ncbi:Cell division control protein 42 [Mycena sanguinolenta]|uniref:Cell division control protein 42 n=1 Tax=Mycena sanguinolenta TaxID=230812 RepID=A0A8H7CNR0_9AGAR|nr:Cell division control protein 42 [Mycena sanguinolenta]
MNLDRGTCKLVVIGDGAVGKYYFKFRFCPFPQVAEIVLCFTLDTYIQRVGVPHLSVSLYTIDTYVVGLFDTAGQAEYNRLRPLSYPQTDVFVVCFSVGIPPSFENVREKWFPEARHHCPGVPCVLVATQIDLRTDDKELEKMAKQGYLPISAAQGQRMAREVKAARYLECSAKTREGVQNVFDEATAAAVDAARRATVKRNRKCLVL